MTNILWFFPLGRILPNGNSQKLQRPLHEQGVCSGAKGSSWEEAAGHLGRTPAAWPRELRVRAGVAASTGRTAQAEKRPTVSPAKVLATVARKSGEQLSPAQRSAQIPGPGFHRGKDPQKASGPNRLVWSACSSILGGLNSEPPGIAAKDERLGIVGIGVERPGPGHDGVTL